MTHTKHTEMPADVFGLTSGLCVRRPAFEWIVEAAAAQPRR